MVYEVICKECEKKIDVNIDKHTLIGTYNGDRVEDESYFHFACFVKWYNHKVSEKAKNSVGAMQNKVQGLMQNPKIAGLLSMIGGTDKLQGMLNTDLSASDKLTGEGKTSVNDLLESLMGGAESGDEKSSVEKVNNNGNTKKRKPRAKTTKKKVQ